jgi:hypothetical protein
VRAFPVLFSVPTEVERLRALGCPDSVPWAMLAPHERQARLNHDQSLKTLASRGGLGACEMVAVLEDRRWHRMADEEAVSRLLELVAAYDSRNVEGT